MNGKASDVRCVTISSVVDLDIEFTTTETLSNDIVVGHVVRIVPHPPVSELCTLTMHRRH